MSATRVFLGALAVVAGAFLGGCATASTGHPDGPLVASNAPRGGALSRASDSTASASASTRDTFGNPVSARDGIPIPEPAVPERDGRLAGPTPQVPIPVGSRPGVGLYN